MSCDCIKRLQKELQQLHKNPLPGIHAEPSVSSLKKWHYVIIGDKDTAFSGGVYHGTIQFPDDYPFSPPTSIRMLTPNGRFTPNGKICMSITSFHPESWSPSWSISTILLGFQSYFYGQEGGIGVLYGTAEGEIRRLAAQSMAFNTRNKEFCVLFPYLLSLEDELANGAGTKRKATNELIEPQEKQHKTNNNETNSTMNDVEIVYISNEVIDLT